MPSKTDPQPDINSWLEDELYHQYLRDQAAVDTSWKGVFESMRGNGAAVAKAAIAAPPVEASPSEQLVPLRGAAARIATNMAASLSVPTATSQRIIPVKVVEENRRIVNQHRTLTGQSKISYSHILGYAILQALKDLPGMNDAFIESGGESFRSVRKQVNLGIAVDVAGSGGTRALMVPSIKNAGALDFASYQAAFDDLVSRARRAKLTVDDFKDTSISLTNPGTVGTLGSVPRLMPGQGCIIAVGAIDYPAEYQGASRETIATLGLSKVMTITCTYDHRVIQGAESGLFLGKLYDLLQGAANFYEIIFASLRIPHQPMRWQTDRSSSIAQGGIGRRLEIAKEAAVLQLINAYRVRGHLIADLDPLGKEPGYHPELDPATYGLTIWDLDRDFLTGTLGAAIGEAAPKPFAPLRDILETLRKTYCGKIGCEYMHIQHPEEKTWLQKRMEPEANSWPFSPEDRVSILDRLLAAEQFEAFLHSRFVGQKRFSLEGAETTIPLLDELLDRAAAWNVREVVVGMAHRGRLNVLANVIGKPLSQIFSEFEGHPDPNSAQGSGDVKYHLGAKGKYLASTGTEVSVSVAPNPSHLEAVDPVVEGIVRPKQDRSADKHRQHIIPVLIHGDAAFAGQGVVAETLNLSQLPGYTTGGTMHLIINNQIGFTAGPEETRSSPYCTDVARTVQAPVFHVNGDDPEACSRVVQVAFDFRQQFKKDVVIDMICYRRHGHNEGDDPSFTQPLLYRKIKDHASPGKIYADRLIREGVLSQEDVEKLRKAVIDRLETGFQEAKLNAVRYEVEELGVADPALAPRVDTAAEESVVRTAIQGLTTFPSDFHLHPKLQGFIAKRKATLDGGPIDWAFAETLAFGTLAMEGTPVRLSGQDSARGTFSQRHVEFCDSETGKQYTPLKKLAPNQARFEVWDSSLSEYAVLGFEFGYSIGDPSTLVLWEAQFGDFFNGAQIMIDQFIAVAESKWGQPTGIVLLLPHGYEGQGPEHSSARIERFLTLCAEDNMQLANCTTPAQYFHLLRRQMNSRVRKPLVIFTPKSLLRHPLAVSTLADLTSGTFHEIIGDTVTPSKVDRVLFCSGKIYYDLLAAREAKGANNVAIIRMEQIYPFAKQQVQEQLQRYPATADVAWVQEEPRNMGAWRFMNERFGRPVRYIGRTESASPATGSYKRHQSEQQEIMDAAFAIDKVAPVKKVRVVRTTKK
jgi:2-oxoglutarate dehydrogenase E1 component